MSEEPYELIILKLDSLEARMNGIEDALKGKWGEDGFVRRLKATEDICTENANSIKHLKSIMDSCIEAENIHRKRLNSLEDDRIRVQSMASAIKYMWGGIVFTLVTLASIAIKVYKN
jgi:hypothetical protein